MRRTGRVRDCHHYNLWPVGCLTNTHTQYHAVHRCELSVHRVCHHRLQELLTLEDATLHRMADMRWLRAAAILLVPGALAYAVVGLLRTPADDSLSKRLESVSQRPLEGALPTELVAATEAHEALIRELSEAPTMPEPSVVAAARTDSQHGGATLEPLLFDLADYFAHRLGHLDARYVARHEALNSLHRDLGSDESSWISVVEFLNNRYRRLADNYDASKLKEMIHQIEGGSIPHEEREPPSESQLRALAKQLIDGCPELRTKGYDEDSLAQELKAAPPVMDVFEDHVVHKGQVYLTRRFKDLPVSTRMLQDVRYFASECLMACYAFFQTRGYAPSDASIAIAMERLASSYQLGAEHTAAPRPR